MDYDETLWRYNCLDCCYTFEVDEAEQLAVDKMGLREVHDFQQDLFHAVLRTMITGLRLHDDERDRLCRELSAEIATREAWLLDVVGHPLNPKSPKQMSDFFYRELAQRPNRNREGGLTCDDDALTKIGQREPLLLPLLRVIAELRSLGVFLSTFASAPADTDGRMRCSYNIAGTETYRFSSSENAFGTGMNMQNIPSGDEDAIDTLALPNIRKVFITDPDHTFFDIDLDSSDLRVVVWESNCKEMKQMFAEGLKPYVEVAKEYYKDPTITKHHPRYKTFKAFAHATDYLGTASGISARIGLTAHEVDSLQQWWFGKFPEIKDWQEKVKSEIQSKRYLQNIFGYRWHVFDRIEGNLFNRAVAWLGQSTTACVINRGYLNLHKHHPKVQVLLQVHDSLGGQYPSNNDVYYQKKIIESCSIILPYNDPMTIPVSIKTSSVSWGACK